MLYVGLDLSRKRLDWHALLADGQPAAVGACPPDRDGLARVKRYRPEADAIDDLRPLFPARR